MSMAQSALATLHALKHTTAPSIQHQGQLDLLNKVFAPLVSHPHHHHLPHVAHDHPVYHAMEALFGSIAALRNPSANHKIPPIKVYCDFARIHEDHLCHGRAAPGIACDTHLEREFPISPLYTECRTGPSSLPVLPAEAFGHASPHHHDKHIPVQICRDYLDRIKALPEGNFVSPPAIFNISQTPDKIIYIQVDTTPRQLVMQPSAIDRRIFSHRPSQNIPPYFDLALLRELVTVVQRETGPWAGNDSVSAPATITPDSLVDFTLGSVLLQAEDNFLAKQRHSKMTFLSRRFHG
ncbi:uncharacterized protein BDW47DRAFT_128787 [Aspergillus candidus]|uniref:Uncharacterized protein n=1 Tax=Aspergillus candidus TaxID=41067 RepID=A0A2I2F2A3_ASPCN|nr:hypothetical protein BDW47DRAFT_128787 [Aspergillus candidus]PLB34763.1 hypothetical protein BDW47DRAFT_128787 [Aspergillus candidus]